MESNYLFNSLGIQTNFIMNTFQCEIKEKEDYFVIRSPKRPDYFWGNYLLFKTKPRSENICEYIDTFEKEIGKRSDIGFCALTFDSTNISLNLIEEFKKQGFNSEVSNILVLDKLNPHIANNNSLEVREYDLIKHMDEFIEVHYDEDWGYGSHEVQIKFLKDQALDFHEIIVKGKAKRFGAFFEGRLVSDLGIYWQDEVIRFNNVGTHMDFRRKGACRTLVYNVSRQLLKGGAQKVVMQADEDYFAGTIYESIGYRVQEKIVDFEWKDSRFT